MGDASASLADATVQAEGHEPPAGALQHPSAITPEQVEAIYVSLLGRKPESDDAIAYHIRSHASIEDFRDFVLSTDECIEYISRKLLKNSEAVAKAHADANDYQYFFILLRNKFSEWKTTYLIILALLQYVNSPDRAALEERFRVAAIEDDFSRLVNGREINFGRVPQRFWPPNQLLEHYQDARLPGRTISGGVRGCEERYQMIRGVAARFNRPFSVFDLGSNLGYFAVRLVEEFDCFVVCCEGIYASWLRAIVSKSAKGRIVVLAKTLTIDDLEALAGSESFDLVLAMSVVHHVDAPLPRTMLALRRLGWKVIVELPTESGACGQQRVAEALAHDWQQEGGELLGRTGSHLQGSPRPTILYDGINDGFVRSYMYSQRPFRFEVQRDWDSAWIVKNDRARPLVPALNLHSYLCLNGIWPLPSDGWIDSLRALSATRHGDIMPWNFLISSDGLSAIDFNSSDQWYGYPDGLCRGLVEDLLGWASHDPVAAPHVVIDLARDNRLGGMARDGFARLEGGEVCQVAPSALMVLEHAYDPDHAMTIEIEIAGNGLPSFRVRANQVDCEATMSSPDGRNLNLRVEVTREALLRNYPLLLQFELDPADDPGEVRPIFRSLVYRPAGS